jgi:hypothetical protein
MNYSVDSVHLTMRYVLYISLFDVKLAGGLKKIEICRSVSRWK